MIPRWFSLRPALAVALLVSFANPAYASDSGEGTEVRKKLFPSFKKKSRATDAEKQGEAKPTRAVVRRNPDDPMLSADQPAEELSENNTVSEFVKLMEGEIPTEEQVEALEEAEAVKRDLTNLVDDIAGKAVERNFWSDPKAAMKVDPLYLDLVDPADYDIPVEVNPAVKTWVAYFTGKGRKHFERWLSRSSRYRPMMYRELDKKGLPRDLVYLSMIESGYNAHAYSHAGAAGLWQFMPATGKAYKLRVDWWMDDRRDPEASLHAAMALLTDLHKMFDGDWRLAWGAYNAGPGRIRRAMRNAGSDDFWKIAAGPHLRAETDNYIPKIMAAAIVGHNPERYGFKNIEFQDELRYETVHVKGRVDLENIAKATGVKVDDIKALNPALRRYSTPPEGSYLRLPVKTNTVAFLSTIKSMPAIKRTTIVRHTVKRGETLSSIAGRYGSSVSAISRTNNLKNINRVYVGMSLIVPKSGSGSAHAAAPPRSSKAKTTAKRATSHTVRKGDTLSGVASKYGLSTSQVRSFNHMKSSKIMVGQKLSLTGSSSKRSTKAKTTYHTVRKGEILSKIASKYGVKQSDLQRWNGIRNASHIKVGQKLKVVGGKSTASKASWRYHTVRSGESLGRLSNKYGVSVSTLRQWNGLKSSTIHPGQKLKVKKG